MASIPSGPSKNMFSSGRALSSPLELMARAWAPITNLCQEAPIHSLTHFLLSFLSSSYGNSSAQVCTMLQPQLLGLLQDTLACRLGRQQPLGAQKTPASGPRLL